MHDININDEYGYGDFNFLIPVLNSVLKHEKVENAIFSITLVNDEIIKDINFEYRNIDRITDVLSFAFEENDNIMYNEFRLLGDIFISIPQMKRQALDYNHSEIRELSFLAVHGLLHLLGYDHETAEEEKIMFNLQEMILNGNDIKREA